MSSTINSTIIKILALKSGNLCAFPGCKQKLAVDGNNINGAAVLGEMAHIAGEKPGAQRYDSNMTHEQRSGLGNLIYLCPTHHTQIDKPGNTYTVEAITSWRTTHEALIEQAIMDSLPDVTFGELEIVTKALADGVDHPFDGDFHLTDPEEKMKRNGMTAKSRIMLTTGLGGSPQVRAFIQSISTTIPRFEDHLRSGFQKQYDQLWSSGLRGDALFEQLCIFACKFSANLNVRAASVAVVAYLFETCDVFQR